MPTVLTHAVAALGLGAAFFGRKASVLLLPPDRGLTDRRQAILLGAGADPRHGRIPS